MLLEFTVENFRSFKEPQTLSMVANKRDKSLEGNLIDYNKMKLLKSAAVMGANASGKSNLIKAFHAFSFLVNNSIKKNPGEAIYGEPHLLDKRSRNKPSIFEIKFIYNDIRYDYKVSLDQVEIHYEALFSYPKNRVKKLFERARIQDNNHEWSFSPEYSKTDQDMLQKRVLDNTLALSVGANLNIPDCVNALLFFSQLWVFSMSENADMLTRIMHNIIEHRSKEDVSLKEKAIDTVKKLDPSIQNIIFEKNKKMESDSISVNKNKEKDFLRIFSKHKIHGSKNSVTFDFYQNESCGTQRLLALAGPYNDALSSGALLVIDEIDCSMHPLVVRSLIESFNDTDLNKNGAQMIFTTHDSTLMDTNLLRRDQIWLTEKNEQEATELFSLYDFDTKDRPRNTEALQKNYLAGRYGGVPDIDELIEES